jgi:hypothetical protein
MPIRIKRTGYAADWVCPCGWTSPIRDTRGRTLHEPNLPAIAHAKTCEQAREVDL